MDIRDVHRSGLERVETIANEDRCIRGARLNAPMATANKGCIEWNSLKQCTHSQLANHEFASDIQRWKSNRRVKKQLKRVISRLAVNIDSASKVGRTAIVGPPRISEPCSRGGNGKEIATSRMMNAKSTLRCSIMQFINSGIRGKQRTAHRFDFALVLHIDVRYLVVTYGKRATSTSIKVFAAIFFTNRQKASGAK